MDKKCIQEKRVEAIQPLYEIIQNLNMHLTGLIIKHKYVIEKVERLYNLGFFIRNDFITP